ncbi:MAG: M28 family peptidase [Candidatus Aminicenantes bacterium]|nr:M28 family peptidase [Candidatus Aminicenantes bacterium]
MRNPKLTAFLLGIVFVFGMAVSASAQSKGLKSITAEAMKPPMKFLSAKEFRGRSAPSADLTIASKYIALQAERIGLKPLMPNGSYFQDVPVEVTTMSPAKSYLRLLSGGGEQKFYFPQSFTTNVRTGGEWAAAGGLVFIGSVLSGAEPKWDDSLGIDLRGKFAVVLEVPLPASETAQRTGAAGALFARTRVLREKGAIGLITIIGRERENNLIQKGLVFDVSERLRFLDVDTVNPMPPATPQPTGAQPQATIQAAPAAPFYTAEVRHEAGAAILGVSRAELDQMFNAMGQGQPVPAKALEGKLVDIAVVFQQRKDATPNIVAYLPGSDSQLKNEYIVIGSHHDHNPPREGRIFPGADDNISGGAAMLEIAKALMIERPKRSVIFVWHTAEERGLVGAYYFVQHSPVPVEKISANLNLDMVSRNDPNGIYLIGSNKLSTEFDKSIHDMNSRYVGLKLDYKYEDPGEPSRFFFRSDQYPYIRYGIPGVWFFSGTTEDYHRETDVEGKCDYGKMVKVTKLAYAVAMNLGNKPGLCKLDINPEITTRGKHNMKIVWQRPPQPQQKR